MNTTLKSTRLLTLSERVYRALLILYPSKFRRDYGQHMAQVFRDVCRDAYRQGGAFKLANWWATALLDLLETVIAEHRKVDFSMSKARFIQWSGWLCILGGLFFALSSISQLQPGSHDTFDGVYQLSVTAIVPGMALITLGLLGMFLRYNSAMNLFGKLALLAALIGAAVTAFGWLLTLTGGNFYSVFMVGLLLYLAGHTVFGGFATTIHLLPKWNFALLIGSALPLTLIMLSFANQPQEVYGANWGGFAMLMLVSIGWVLTGIALNSKPAASIQVVTAAG